MLPLQSTSEKVERWDTSPGELAMTNGAPQRPQNTFYYNQMCIQRLIHKLHHIIHILHRQRKEQVLGNLRT